MTKLWKKIVSKSATLNPESLDEHKNNKQMKKNLTKYILVEF